MAAPRSARARKAAKKAPARRRNATVKDLPGKKAAKVVGGIESVSSTTATTSVSIAPTNNPSLPGSTQALL